MMRERKRRVVRLIEVIGRGRRWRKSREFARFTVYKPERFTERNRKSLRAERLWCWGKKKRA